MNFKGCLKKNNKGIEFEKIDFEHLSKNENYNLLSNMFATEKARYHEVLKNAISKNTLTENMPIYSTAFNMLNSIHKEKIDAIYYTPEKIKLSEILKIKTTSVSKIEKFYTCPYSYYFQYILKLKKRKDGEFEGNENGRILHYVLERFFTDYKDNKILDNSLNKLAIRYFDDAIKKFNYEYLYKKNENKRTFDRLKNEAIKLVNDMNEIIKRSKFCPCYLEAYVGSDELKPIKLNVNGKTIELKGYIDRVDMLDDEFIIIDYKTNKSAKLELKEIYYGTKIQLHIYMKAIQESLNKKPVGVVILPVYANFIKDNCKYKYSGQVSDNFETLKNIDSLLEVDCENAIVPYKARNNKMNKNVHLSSDNLTLLGDYSIRMAENAVSKIDKGYIKPISSTNSCEYCNFKDICKYKENAEKKMSTINIDSIIKSMDELSSQNADLVQLEDDSFINTQGNKLNKITEFAEKKVCEQNKIKGEMKNE